MRMASGLWLCLAWTRRSTISNTGRVGEAGADRFRCGRVCWPGGDATFSAPSGARHFCRRAGGKLPHMGQKKFDMITPEGHWAQATFQVPEVTRPLYSVSNMWWSTSKAGRG